MRKWLLRAAIGVGLFTPLALWAQSVVTSNLAGTELLRASIGLQPGGSGIFVPSYVLRNGRNHQLVATGTTIATQALISSGALLATGAITTWNITLPVSPYDGETITIACPGGDTTTLSIAASATPSGQTIVGTNPTSCTASTATSSMWLYHNATKVWYRIR